MEEKVEVWDSNENVIAVFSKYDENTKDKMLNPRVNLIQNGESTFSFQISADSEKWKTIQSVENLYYVNGHVFSAQFEGAYVETLNEDGSILLTVNCIERQKLLEQVYVKAWNSETGFDVIDDFMVVILSNGDLDLKNNGVNVNPTYEVGTAGYILQGLLYDTGWTVGVVDVDGKFDFETDQVDVYNNVLQVQELFGGILIFDSVNKIVHLRDEIIYTNYKGYEVRYTKNMISSEKVYNNKIVTRLIPLGEANLNIKSVNEGLIYISDYSFSNQVTYEIIHNDNIYDAQQLLKWGKRKLKDMCKPAKELTVKLADLRTQEGHELEQFDLNDIVAVIDYKGKNSMEHLRVIRWEYNVFAIYDSNVDLGDATLNTTDIFKKISIATNDLINGTITSIKVIDPNTRKSLSTRTQEFDKFMEETSIAFVATNDSIATVATETKTAVNGLTDDYELLRNDVSILEQTAQSATANIRVIGGENKVINSVGFYGTDQYTISGGIASNAYFGEDANVKAFTESGCKVQPDKNQTITHAIIPLFTGESNIYTITFKVKNTAPNNFKFTMTGTKPYGNVNNGYESYENGIVTIIDTNEDVPSGAAGDEKFRECVYSFTVIGDVTYSVTNTTTSSTARGFYSDLIIIPGERRSDWQLSKNEVMGSSVSIYYNGIEVISEGSSIKTIINNTGFTVVDLESADTVVININNQRILLGKDTTIKGKLEIQSFTIEEAVINGDTVLMIL